ncbi:MAG: ATP synthase subunit I [Oscillospiraceae bacterium]|nr:ATP synthase subunit I [Oscillospiraceae bacterium]
MDSRKLILQQTGIVAAGETVGVAAMIGIFALLGSYDSTVLLGGIVGGVMTVLNFFVMALTVNIAADKAVGQNPTGGKATIRVSYIVRMAVLFLVLFAFANSGLCDPIALVVPLIFSRFTLTLAEFFRKKPGGEQG